MPTRRTFLTHSAAALTLTRGSLLRAFAPAMPPPQPLPFGSIRVSGDLGQRTAQNFARLQDPLYRPPEIFRGTNWQAWPGDMEGRALLALTLLSRATGDPPAYLPAMLAAYPAQLNPDGYFGPVLDLRAINEQQLSGHGWFLRGLCESYEATGNPATLLQVRAIVRNLALPLRGSYATYPIDPAAHARTGGINGSAAGQHGAWVVSTDTACAFIFLDGLTHAWVLLRAARAPEAPALKSLIDEAIARFRQIDLIPLQAQTHATLTALRAILRVYAATGDHALLTLVQDGYLLYRTTAMTEHFANTNWFGRPDSWTEPCAILDSFLLTTQLWQHTADPAYLEDAHRIWSNGAGRGLRANGGFGTDTCPGPHAPFVRVRSYEAYFCCTMRGGEGHARAIQSLYFTHPPTPSEPASVTLPFFAPSTATLPLGPGHTLTLRQTTAYPYAGAVTLEVLASTAHRPVTLRLFAPTFASDATLLHNGQPVASSLDRGFLTLRLTPRPGDVLTFSQHLRVGPRDPHNPGSAPGTHLYQAGPLLLASAAPPADFPASTTGSTPGSAAPALTLRSPDPPPITLPRSAPLTPTADPGRYHIAASDTTRPVLLAPLNDLNTFTPTPSPKDPCPRQLLFREP